MNEINLCLCYFQYFLIKIATIKNKSNFAYLNTNQKPFAYRQIMPNLGSRFPIKSKLMLIAFVLCYQVSSGRYTTKEQEDILEKNDSNIV